VEAGKTADLLVLDADPLKDITAIRKIRMVLSHGKAYDRAKLDAMLADVKRWVEQHPAPAQ
jgi:imidazolonepropionase-like amidohydrolase